MSRLYRSHSASTIHRNHLSGIATSSVSKHPVPIYPRRRSRLNELRFHPQFLKLCDSSRLCQEVQIPIIDIPDDYITNLKSSKNQERNNSITKTAEQPQKQQQTPTDTSKKSTEILKGSQEYQQTTIKIFNSISNSAMSSRRSGHSSSKGSSRRSQTSHVSQGLVFVTFPFPFTSSY